MCMQCLVNPLYFGEVVPGWYLIRARREHYNSMDVGDWGLLRSNDPDIIFKTTPLLEPPDADPLYDTFYQKADEFYNELVCDPYLGYLLVDACKKNGYDHENHGFFHIWFFDYLAKHINKTEPKTEQDPMPELDSYCKHDYTLGKT